MLVSDNKSGKSDLLDARKCLFQMVSQCDNGNKMHLLQGTKVR